MRTGARGRGLLQRLVRSRCFLGLCLLALLAGLAQVEIAGRSLRAAAGQLLISPAEAGRASRWPRAHGSDLRGPRATFNRPAFVPSGPAFAPSGPGFAHSRRPPPVAAFPHHRPFSAPEVRKPAQAFAPSSLVRPEPRAERVGRPGIDMPRPLARETAVGNGWRVLIHPAAVRPDTARPALPPLPQPSAMPHIARPHMPFHRLREKLSRAPRGSRPTKEAAPPPAAQPRERAARANGPARSARASSRLGGRPIGELLPSPGTFRSSEVLAINLSAEALARAQASNYQVVERIGLPAFGLTITRLRPPDTLNAVSGRDLLFDLLPEDGFTLNHVYAPYRPGMGPHGPGAAIEAQAGKDCPASRCFGSALIKWQPRLAACARDVKVGVIDTGFDRSHPAFAGVRYAYREFLPEGSPRASEQHGTGVLSLLAGTADSGTPGLIPDASYVVANAFFADADGQPVSDTAHMLQALHWLKTSGVAVVNLSFAGPEDELVHHAIQELTKAGAVVVAAAGNEGPAAPPSYPAAYEEVIAVTAVDRNLAAYRYANRGAHIDLAAPGVDVWTALPGRREGPQTGTSFAVPYVTAVVAVSLPAGAGPAPRADALAPKRRALTLLQGNVKGLGGHPGDLERDPTFGAGLVQAPAFCGPAVAVAANVTAPAQPWAGTVQRAVEPVPVEPLVVGAWVSAVHAASVDGAAR